MVGNGTRGGGRWILGLALVVAAVGAAWFTLWPRGGAGGGEASEVAREQGGPRFTAGESAPTDTSGVIAGRVLDPDGKAAAGASVIALRRFRSSDPPRLTPALPTTAVTTGADGTFRITGLEPGQYSVAAIAPNFGGATRRGVDVTSGVPADNIELALTRGGILLSGRVLDAGGGVLSGARVRVTTTMTRPPTPGAAPPDSFAFEVQSDGEGTYRLHLARNRYSVQVQAEGYASTRDFVELAGDETRDFKLEPASRIAGRVLTADKHPVAGATVRADSTARRFELTEPVTTDDAGAFRFSSLTAGTYQISARQGTLVGSSAEPVTVAAATEAGNVEVVVHPGLSISGMVKTRDGKPVAGASVTAFPRGPMGMMGVPRSGLRPSPTDAQGRFAVEGLTPGEYQVSVNLAGRPGASDTVVVRSALTKDFVIDDPVVVTGVVLTSAGGPAPNATVEALIRPDGPGGRGTSDRATTNAEGKFTLERLGPGEMTLSASANDEAARLSPERLKAGETKQLTVRLAPGARVSGFVTWDDGKPAPNIKILGTAREGGRPMDADVRTGADGSFTVGPFAAGDVSVVAQAPGDRISWSSRERPEQVDLKVAAGEHKRDVKLVVARRAGVIRGVVLDPNGSPFAGASISAAIERDGRAYRNSTTSRTISGPDGAFAVEGLEKGSYTLWAAGPDSPELEKANVAVDTSVKLQLGRGASLAGLMVDSAGKPVPSYTLIVVPPGRGAEGEASRFRRASTGEGALPPVQVSHPAGAFRVSRLAPGTYDIVATAADGTVGKLSGVVVREAEAKQGLRLTVERAVRVTGRLIDYDTRQPMPGVRVQIRQPAGAPQSTTSDGSGAFALANVAPVPGLTFSVTVPPTHMGKGEALPVAKDGRIELGDVFLLKKDPRNPNRGRMGLTFHERDGRMMIGGVMPGTPAEKAGIKKHDAVLSIDGVPAAGDLGAVMRAMRGDPGKEVKLTVQTPGEKPREVSIRPAL